MYFNPILMTDSYKCSHWKQYPPGTNKIYSYYESRGGQFPWTVFFGVSHVLRTHLLSTFLTMDDVQEAKEKLHMHFGSDHFNDAGWKKLVGRKRWPVRIKAVPEGTVVPCGNVLMTIENTEPEFFWLTNFLETLLCQLWYPITVATLSRHIKTVIQPYLEKTGTPETLDYKLHDFGMRGATGLEAACYGGAAHLINFKGTDTLPAIEFLNDYYNTGDEYQMYGLSVPASEHSTMTSWGQDHEVDAYRNMLESYPEGTLSVVSDSYDIFNACKNIWGGDLKEQVKAHRGTIVIRPDSGPPIETMAKVFGELSAAFGTVNNEKGYCLLPNNVRILWGDGLSPTMIKKICEDLVKRKISLDNVTFGMGGGLLQKIDRDTCKMAFKCSYAEVNGKGRDVYKNPVTAPGKVSKRGRLKLVQDDSGAYTTVAESDPRPDCLIEVFNPDDGICVNVDFADVRERAKLETQAEQQA